MLAATALGLGTCWIAAFDPYRRARGAARPPGRRRAHRVHAAGCPDKDRAATGGGRSASSSSTSAGEHGGAPPCSTAFGAQRARVRSARARPSDHVVRVGHRGVHARAGDDNPTPLRYYGTAPISSSMCLGGFSSLAETERVFESSSITPEVSGGRSGERPWFVGDDLLPGGRVLPHPEGGPFVGERSHPSSVEESRPPCPPAGTCRRPTSALQGTQVLRDPPAHPRARRGRRRSRGGRSAPRRRPRRASRRRR